MKKIILALLLQQSFAYSQALFTTNDFDLKGNVKSVTEYYCIVLGNKPFMQAIDTIYIYTAVFDTNKNLLHSQAFTGGSTYINTNYIHEENILTYNNGLCTQKQSYTDSVPNNTTYYTYQNNIITAKVYNNSKQIEEHKYYYNGETYLGASYFYITKNTTDSCANTYTVNNSIDTIKYYTNNILTHKIIHIYNTNGKLDKALVEKYNSSTKKFEAYLTQYFNDNGNEEKRIYTQPKVTSRFGREHNRSYTYVYDHMNNWVKQTTFIEKDFKHPYIAETVSRTITYF